jgi:class 3 adenylate cyclase
LAGERRALATLDRDVGEHHTPRLMPEERKLVTVLFADIVGSSTLALEHDPEIVRAVLRRMFDALSEVLAGHGGTV